MLPTRRARRACLVTLTLVGGAVLVPETSVSVYPCDFRQARAGKYPSNISAAQGVRGTLIAPALNEISGRSPLRASAGDVALTNSASTAFVQLGWYVGGNEFPSGSYLPYTDRPRVFWGENDSNSASGETLTAGLVLSYDTPYTFEIKELGTSNVFGFYLQGQFQGQSRYAHSVGYVLHNGETNYDCTRMFALARWATAPYRTLQFYYQGSWSYFDGGPAADKTNSPIHFSSPSGDVATNYARGGGS